MLGGELTKMQGITEKQHRFYSICQLFIPGFDRDMTLPFSPKNKMRVGQMHNLGKMSLKQEESK